jgi:hypothetical protein
VSVFAADSPGDTQNRVRPVTAHRADWAGTIAPLGRTEAAVAAKEVTREEDGYSHADFAEFVANVDGCMPR